MVDFLEELFESHKDKGPVVSDVETKPVTETVSVTVETSKQNEVGELVRKVDEVKNETNQVAVPLMSGPCAYVGVEMGTTVNLGNYSNGKVKISFHLPIGVEITPDMNEKLEKSFLFAKGWVEKKLDHETGELAKLRGKV